MAEIGEDTGGEDPLAVPPPVPFSPSPGWYPDPAYPGLQRWWSGRAWTEQSHWGFPAPATTEGVPATLPRASAGQTGIIVGVVLIVVAIAVFVPSVVAIGRTAYRQIAESPTMLVPGTRHFNLPAGQYYVYEGENGQGPVPALSLIVTAPDGSSTPVSAAPTAETMTRYGVSYASIFSFRANSTGEYTLTVRTAASFPPWPVLIAPPLGAVVASVAGWAAAVVLSILVGLAGSVLLILAGVRRSRARRQRAMFPTPGV